MGRDQTAAMDVDQWKAFGGTLDGKVYVAPGGETVAAGAAAALTAARPHSSGPLICALLARTAGERLKTWKAAAKLMAEAKKDAPASGEARGLRRGRLRQLCDPSFPRQRPVCGGGLPHGLSKAR